MEIVHAITLNIQSYSDVLACIYVSRSMALEAGFTLTDEVLLATVASELAVNIMKFTDGGILQFKVLKDVLNNRMGVQIISNDEGPGIDNVSLALTDNYSTLSDSMGQGLPSVKRIMDYVDVTSVLGEGTKVNAVKWRYHEY